MPASGWMRRVIVTIVSTVALTAVLVPRPAQAVAGDFVKYYEVTASSGGKPENLSEIALRFLGSAARSGEIFDLNYGRTQPDGGKLTDPNSLKAGWLLVLPWDAVGTGVRNGTLPTAVAKPPAPKPTATAAAKPTATAAPTTPSASGAVPPGACAGTVNAAVRADVWAQLRLAPRQAWSRGRGEGVIVAVIDSGVDASVAGLEGRVAAGSDIVTGSGRGNVDCLGTGTAMAGLIAAKDDGTMVGIAPAATILPIRVVVDKPSAQLVDQASAIDVAVSAGASVIALGAYIDAHQAPVRQAVLSAASHGVVVVMGASTAAAGSWPREVIRVGAMGVDGQLATTYATGAVDVVAPGTDVSSLGIKGTGMFRGSGIQYAVAFVAGEVALLRGAAAHVTPTKIVDDIMHSASPLSGGPSPDPRYGWGLIDPSKAIALVSLVDAPPDTPSTPRRSTPVSTTAIVVTAIIAIIVAALLAWRIRRLIRYGTPGDGRTPVEGETPPFDRPPGTARPRRADDVPTAPLGRPRRSAVSLRETAADGAASSRGTPPSRAGTDADLGSSSSYGTIDVTRDRQL